MTDNEKQIYDELSDLIKRRDALMNTREALKEYPANKCTMDIRLINEGYHCQLGITDADTRYLVLTAVENGIDSQLEDINREINRYKITKQ